MPKTLEAMRRRKKFLLERRAQELALQAEGQGDNMALFFVEEELRDVNAHLRTLNSSCRVSQNRMTSTAHASDHQQYLEWFRQDCADNGQARAAMYQAVQSCQAHLTGKQLETFRLWSAGMKMADIGKKLGVNKSTVSRTIARLKQDIRRRRALVGKITEVGEQTLLDVSDPNAAAAVLSCITAKQAVCLYLYYGGGLSLRKTAALTGTDKSSVLRTLQRGLDNIGKCLGYQNVVLKNLETLGNLVGSVYREKHEPPAPKKQHIVKQLFTKKQKEG